MFGKLAQQIRSRSDLEILKLETGRDIAADKHVTMPVEEMRGKPYAGWNRGMPALSVADSDLLMPPVWVDHVDRYAAAGVMVPDLVRPQSMKRRKLLAGK